MAKKLLSGLELAGFIKERQAKQVRQLRQAHAVFPKLVILTSPQPSSVIETYVRMKRRYGDDILIETEVEAVAEQAMSARIAALNSDPSVHGIIVQLPLTEEAQTDVILATIDPMKDVDGLGPQPHYDSATATAINWLLTGYGIDLTQPIAIVGQGRLVGVPLARMWRSSGYDVSVIDEHTEQVADILLKSRVIVTAAGVPRLITSDQVADGAVIVDAGTTSEQGVLVGDVDESVRARDDVTITPERGGVGPLTIAALYDHVIAAARAAGVKKTS